MKRLNKFLLTLGSVASLASLPLIAANCGGTKKEVTKEERVKNIKNKINELNEKAKQSPFNKYNIVWNDFDKLRNQIKTINKDTDDKKLAEIEKSLDQFAKKVEELSKPKK
ncbi:variable surface lipoprotein [Metamycoplasma auris]|uniref:Variable surface lipoprotein n=1 Tax=Metamycoplasma auris TaxID=51363 RepID=A0A2W7G2E6_9BACT|nr:variable surface lipoprotein [Metamycoplasma auris]PZV97737.1 hypothetical protein BCF89_1203 [Metamycoplasma auris]